MKGILRNIWLGLLAVAAVVATGCSTDEPDPAPQVIPEIEISAVTSNASSVTFTITTKNAAKFTYSVALQGASGTEVTREKTTATETVSSLEADKNYVIKAVAIAADGTKSKEVTHEFVTNPKAMLVIEKNIKTSTTSATLKLTTTNATSASYIYYEQGKKPAEPTWTKVAADGNTVTVELTKLTAKTTYLLEAYATNAEGDSATVTSDPFTTTDTFSLKFGTGNGFVIAQIDFDKTLYSGIHVSTMVNVDDKEGNMFYTLDMFLYDNYKYQIDGNWVKNYQITPIFNEPKVEQFRGFGNAKNEYSIFTVCLDLEGKAILSTGKEWKVTQGTEDVFTGTAAASIVNQEAMLKQINLELTLSPDVVAVNRMFFTPQSMLDANFNNPETYAKAKLNEIGTLIFPADENWDGGNGYFLENGNYLLTTYYLAIDTKFYCVVVPLGVDGKYGRPVVKTLSTSAIVYHDDILLTTTDQVVSSFSVDLKLTGPSNGSILGSLMSAKEFDSPIGSYAGKDEVVIKRLIANNEQLWLGEDGAYSKTLKPSTKYYLFAMPVSEDGKFGHYKKIEITSPAATFEGGEMNFTLTPKDPVYKLDENNNPTDVVDYYRSLGITPDPNCKVYYVGWANRWSFTDPEVLDPVEAALALLEAEPSPISEQFTESLIDQQERIFILLPRDKSGKWCKPIIRLADDLRAGNAAKLSSVLR